MHEGSPGAQPAHQDVEQRTETVFERGLELTRYVILLPVVLLLLSAFGAFVYAVVLFVDSIRTIDDHPFPVHRNLGYFVVEVDLLLVGATLFIAAVGFYELFVPRRRPDTRRGWLPAWLVMRDLNDLKARVISMLVLIAGVTFVDFIVDFHSGRDVLFLGTGVAVVIVALTIFLRFGPGSQDRSER